MATLIHINPVMINYDDVITIDSDVIFNTSFALLMTAIFFAKVLYNK